MPHSGHMILRAWWQKICHMGGWDHVMLNDQWYGALQKAKYGMLLENRNQWRECLEQNNPCIL